MSSVEPTRIAFERFGLRCGVTIDDPVLAGAARRLLPPGRTATSWHRLDVVFRLVTIEAPGDSFDSGHFHLYVDETLAEDSAGRWEALFHLERAVRSIIARGAKGCLLIHAGVVAWHGAAIVLPGNSRSGKSTLVAALIDAGATYLSDEVAVIDRQGRVHPYPKPVYLRDRPRTLERWQGVAPDLAVPMDSAPLPIGIVAALTYDQQAGWAVDAVSPARATMLLGDHCAALRSFPQQAFALLGRAVADADAIVGTRGEADQAARTLLHRLDTGAPRAFDRVQETSA